ncbi:MAG: Bro-N domain-containing protein [Candidatus Diapherotrites archaeon]|jgi:DNA-damage-inducible protein D|nr:Bro-N domain-containing protein [Candidatus Diapherotrites archaeon]MBT4597014.1 Bro-N domain-containing protein [Candidatus Diapherotrites archaeon]
MKELAVFQGKEIRKKWFKDEWWFSVVDIVEVLTDSKNSRNYWNMLKVREKASSETELYTFCVQLKMRSSDNKMYKTDCTNTEGAFRIIQSIPSKKAEPFKLWLAKTGYERVQEINDPELAQDRAKSYYEMKGYPKIWIDKRLRGIAIRQELTDEWKERQIKNESEFAILTNEISKATFGKTVGEYKKFKELKKKNQNLRDRMTDWELILTMVGEKATTDITKIKDSRGLGECICSANEGGTIASNTRKAVEEKTGKSIISKENYLHLNEKKKLVK